MKWTKYILLVIINWIHFDIYSCVTCSRIYVWWYKLNFYWRDTNVYLLLFLFAIINFTYVILRLIGNKHKINYVLETILYLFCIVSILDWLLILDWVINKPQYIFFIILHLTLLFFLWKVGFITTQFRKHKN